MTRFLIVGNDGRVRRIIADKNGVTIRPATVTLNTLLDGSRRNKANLLWKKLGSKSTPWRNIIDNPDPPPVRGQDKIVVAWLNREIAHGYCGEPATFKLCPGFSGVDRNKKTKLSS